MNDLQIDCFLAVARNLSFTKAASELYISQPAVSRQIAALEDKLGFVLFDRSKRNIKLTKSGELFFNLFSKYRLEFLETINIAKKCNGELNGTLVVGCAENWDIANFMPAVLQYFESHHSQVELHLETRGFRELIQGVQNDFLDVIITIDATLRNANLCTRHLTAIPCILLYSIYHPQSQLEAPQMIDFRENIFFVPGEFEGVVDYIKAFCEPYGFEPKIQLVSNVDSAVSRVMNGLGVCVTDVWMRDRLYPSFRYIPIDSSHNISVAWKKSNTNSNIDVFVNELLFRYAD